MYKNPLSSAIELEPEPELLDRPGGTAAPCGTSLLSFSISHECFGMSASASNDKFRDGKTV